MKLWKILFLTTTILLSACTSLTPPAPSKASQLTSLSWAQRQAQLRSLSQWTLQGAFSVSENGQTTMASLLWQQQGRYFTQTISGPLNLGVVRLSGGPGNVTLRKGQQTFSASSPESLMEQQLGWHLPLSNLYYWVRGMPAPGVGGRQQFDTQHHLIGLQQQGWQIQYSNYQTVNGIDLPGQIVMANADIRAKIVIRRWQI